MAPFQLAAQGGIFGLKPGKPQSLFDRQEDFLVFEGFHQVVKGPAFHGLKSGFNGGKGGQDDEGNIANHLPDAVKKLHSVHPRHPQV